MSGPSSSGPIQRSAPQARSRTPILDLVWTYLVTPTLLALAVAVILFAIMVVVASVAVGILTLILLVTP